MCEIDWLKKYVSALLHCSERKLKKMSFVSDRHFKEGGLNFKFSIASIKLNHGDIFSFSHKSNLMIATFAQSF